MTICTFNTDSPPVKDKWILSSAVQKLIRRGRREEALDVALRLEELSPGYLRRRLSIIALEDIGAADEHSALAVIQLCSSGQNWKEPLAAITAAVTALADAAKSRSACDAACLCGTDPAVRAAKLACRGLPADDLLRVARQMEETWAHRAGALEILGARQGLTRDQVETQLASVANAFGLSQEAHALLRASGGEVRAMAIMLPLVAEAMAAPRTVIDSLGLPGSMETVRGVPLCAVDMHTRGGWTVIADFCRASPELRRFRERCGTQLDLPKAVALAVFYLDGCHMMRHIVTEATEELRERIETLEMALLGITADERPRLYEAISADAELLSQTRARVLRGLP